jgi:hypothetical protein
MTSIKSSHCVKAGFALLWASVLLTVFLSVLCLPVGLLGAASFLWGARKYPYV